jgi:hypothetical protein
MPLGEKRGGQVRSDEPCAPGDEYPHSRSFTAVNESALQRRPLTTTVAKITKADLFAPFVLFVVHCFASFVLFAVQVSNSSAGLSLESYARLSSKRSMCCANGAGLEQAC